MVAFFNKQNWTSFDLSTLGPSVAGYAESLFDGRYIYFGPERNYDVNGRSAEAHSNFIRFDSTREFGERESWERFDGSILNDVVGGSVGMAFDGRYVYYAPFRSGKTGVFDLYRVVARYDTTKAFEKAESWTTFDLRTVHPDAGGYVGADFDGRYVYFCPYYSGTSSVFVRFDTQCEFSDHRSWAVFDALSFDMNLKGYIGARSIAGHVYFSPCFHDLTGCPHGTMLRVSSGSDFSSPESWDVFDLTDFDRTLVGYDGMAIDGRYIYYAPYYPASGWRTGRRHGKVVRYDSTRPFREFSSWESFDAEASFGSQAVGYIGAGYDGTHVYFAPAANSVGYHGNVLRFDTRGNFQETRDWSVFDVSQIDARFNYYDGAIACDGNAMYFVACGPGRMMLRYRFSEN